MELAFDLDFAGIPSTPPTLVAHFPGMLAGFPHRVELVAYCIMALIIIWATIIVIVSPVVNYWMLSWRKKPRLSVQQRQISQEQSFHFLNALLSNSQTPLVVLGTGLNFGNGSMLLQQCMDGPDATIVADTVSRLEKTGQPFHLSAQTVDGRVVSVRGLPIGHRAVLYFQNSSTIDLDIPFRGVLDELPTPVWIRSEKLSLRWGNRAFLAAVGARTLQEALACNTALDQSEIDLAAAARSSLSLVEARRSIALGGQRRTMSINFYPLHSACVAGIAIDMSEVTKAQAEMRLAEDAHTDMLERLRLCIAVFDANQRLMRYNNGYALFWGLSESWLDTHPSLGEVLNHLRESRKLPEQRDFVAWNREQLLAFNNNFRGTEELWHLPKGKSVRVTTQPHLQGGIFVIFEDISEQLRLETSLTLLAQVQKATLDTLDEGIAIFGPDGRLVLHNTHFAALWRLTDNELARQPHLTDIADICNERVGPEAIWSVISTRINSLEPESHDRRIKITRADGRIMSLSSSRLPNGATVVLFVDLTDLERFETLQRESLLDQMPIDVKASRNF